MTDEGNTKKQNTKKFRCFFSFEEVRVGFPDTSLSVYEPVQ